MSIALDRPGIFRATPLQWKPVESKNGAFGIDVKYRIAAILDPDTREWVDWTEADVEIVGQHWLVKTDKTLNDQTVDQVIAALGWSGNFIDFDNENLELTPCQIQVQEEDYRDRKQLKVSWVNPWDYTPGGKAADASMLKQLDSRFGAQARAKAANLKRNAAAPAVPAAPPAASTMPPTKKSDIPF